MDFTRKSYPRAELLLRTTKVVVTESFVPQPSTKKQIDKPPKSMASVETHIQAQSYYQGQGKLW